MAGHSKWANIKHKKGRQDKARGKKFTQLIREITVAAQESGMDISCNPRLRLAVDKAQQANMPKDTISRAIQRGGGELDSSSFVEVRYEGYAAGGVAVIVKCLTDNKNRTVGEVRHAFSKYGGNLGTDGSVAYMFDFKGEIQLASNLDYDVLMELILEQNIEDLIELEADGNYSAIVAADDFTAVRDFLMQLEELTVVNADLVWLANIDAEIDIETEAKVENLLDALTNLDDVQAVYSNFVVV